MNSCPVSHLTLLDQTLVAGSPNFWTAVQMYLKTQKYFLQYIDFFVPSHYDNILYKEKTRVCLKTCQVHWMSDCQVRMWLCGMHDSYLYSAACPVKPHSSSLSNGRTVPPKRSEGECHCSVKVCLCDEWPLLHTWSSSWTLLHRWPCWWRCKWE